MPNIPPTPVIERGLATGLDPLLLLPSGEVNTARNRHFQMLEVDTYAECIQEAVSIGGSRLISGYFSTKTP